MLIDLEIYLTILQKYLFPDEKSLQASFGYYSSIVRPINFGCLFFYFHFSNEINLS